MGRALIGLLLGLALGGVVGCASLRPKPVEVGQAKVPAMPEVTSREREIHRQAVALTAEKAQETLAAALEAAAPAEVVEPAKDTVVLSAAVQRYVGPPMDLPTASPTEVAQQLDRVTATYNRRLEKYREQITSLAGRPVEGTGWLRIPYFWWLGGVGIGFLCLLFVGVVLLRLAGGPWAALGLGVARVSTKLATKGFLQVVRGGERFKRAVQRNFDSATAAKILELFRAEQQASQDEEVQRVIRDVT